MDINALLTNAAEIKASDVHLAAGLPPMIRIDGDLQLPEGITEPMQDPEIYEILKQLLTKERYERLANMFEMDLSLEISKCARFRVNIFRGFNGINVAFRIIPIDIKTLKDLEMPQILYDLCEMPKGLVLVTGPTGTGKSTTLAAMVDQINRHYPSHIITIEDPIEFVHETKKCLIQQREVGQHTQSFANALRSTLREDPDVILVGEMRDLETIRLALTAAETGHLVFATLHTSSAPDTVHRIIDVFPGEDKLLVRSMLSNTLQAVISQVLVKRKNGGRIAVQEILMCNAAVRNLIREDKVPQINTVMQTGKSQGMQTMQQHLEELLKSGVIEVPKEEE